MPVFKAIEDVPAAIDLEGYLSDPDTPVEHLTLSSISVHVKNMTGLWVTFVFPNGVLEANVTIVASDGNSTAKAVVPFTIEPVNDPPRWEPRLESLPDGEQDTFYSFNLTALDEDDDVEDLTYATDASFFTISPTGEVAFVPRNSDIGRNRFNVTVHDPGGLSDTMELVLFIGPYPEWFFIYIGPQVAQEGEVFTLNISQYLVYNWDWIPPEDRLTFTYYDDSTKLVTDPDTGEVVWTPTNQDVGDHYFTIIVRDSLGRTDQMEIKITVEMPHPPPFFPDIGVQDLTQGILYRFTMPLDPHYTTYSQIYGEYTFFNSPEDLFVIDPDNGIISFVPGNELVGLWYVTVGVVGTDGLREAVTMVFNVTNVNNAPTMEHVFDLQLVEGEPFMLKLEGNDVDMDTRRDGTMLPVDPDERLRFSGGPEGGHMDPLTGVWTITPDQGLVDAGPIVVEFEVRDAGGLSDMIQVRLSVANRVLEPSVIIVGVWDNGTVISSKTYTLRAMTVDESGEEWATSFLWYADNRLIGVGREIEWVARGSGEVELVLVADDDEGNAVRTTAVVKMVFQTGRESFPFELFAAFIVVVVTALGLAYIYTLRKRSMAR